MNIINKIFGIQYIKVTYKVTDKNPYTDEHEEPQVKSIILEKDPNWPVEFRLPCVEFRLPCYGHWADVEIISIENV